MIPRTRLFVLCHAIFPLSFSFFFFNRKLQKQLLNTLETVKEKAKENWEDLEMGQRQRYAFLITDFEVPSVGGIRPPEICELRLHFFSLCGRAFFDLYFFLSFNFHFGQLKEIFLLKLLWPGLSEDIVF